MNSHANQTVLITPPDSMLLPHVVWSEETRRIMARMPQDGIFLTGIEGSDPQVDGVRRDQLLEAHNFYLHYKQRLQAIRDLGLRYVRFGLPYSQAHWGENRYNFAFFDAVDVTCRQLGMTILADLLHFGLPDWLHAEMQDDPYFQNPHFPAQFAEYARAFAKRYPHIRFYTLINEPFVTAYFSSKLGMWNEHKQSPWHDDRDFARAGMHIAQAAILARQAIEAVWQEEHRPDEPIFLQNESFEQAYAAPGSGREAEAERFNLRRFAILDLILGHRDEVIRKYLLSQGCAPDRYEWFMEHGSSTQTILGIDFYPTCIHTFTKDTINNHSPAMPYELYEVTKTYWDRYRLPLLHTEVNAWPEHAEVLCQKTYDALARLKQEGYPVLGMGWYGDELQIGWHVAMRGPRAYDENPVGLFYKGQPQPVAKLFAGLAACGMSQQPIVPAATAPAAFPAQEAVV